MWKRFLAVGSVAALLARGEADAAQIGAPIRGRIVDPFDLGARGEMRPVPGASIRVLQYPTVFAESRRDGSFELHGVPVGRAVNLLVHARGFEPTLSADIAPVRDLGSVTAYAVRTWVASAAAVALKTVTGVVGNPQIGMEVDRRLGLIGGLVVAADSGERLPGASVQLVGRGEVGSEIRHLVETEKLTFTSPSVDYPMVRGGFFIANVPPGETLDLIPTRTGSPYTRASYEFARTGVAAVPGAITFVLLPAVKATDTGDEGSSRTSVVFSDVTADIGASFQQRTLLPFFNRYLHALGPGIAVNDYDADGDLDFYVSNGLGFPNLLFRNRGDGTVEGLDSPQSGGSLREDGGVAFGDVDNDGDLDLYVASSQRNTLFLNRGDGRFADVTETAGVGDGRNARSVSFVDYDNDGLLDIFVSNYDIHSQVNFDRNDNPGQGSVLYRNNGDLTFTDVAEAAGIGKTGLAFAQTFTDYDDDGDQDLVIVHDVGRFLLFRNDGDGRFTNVSGDAGLTDTGSWMCAASGDYDNDGDFDLFSTNVGPAMAMFVPRYPGQISNPMHALYRNEGDGTFVDVAREAGVADAGFGWGCEFGDVDNDGWLDLYLVTNYFFMGVGSQGGASLYGRLPDGGVGGEDSFLFLNNGDGTFRNVTRAAGILNPFDARGATLADIDGDGFLDIFVVNERGPLQVYRNQGNGNHWLKVRLVGTRSNRDAIGARVRIVAGGMEQVREVSGGSSYKSQPSFELEFGLGRHRRVDLVEAVFPSGRRAIQRDVEADSVVRIVEP